MGRLLLLLFFIHLGLAFGAVVDCVGGERRPVRLNRTLWTLIAVFGFLAGPIAWFAYGRPGARLQLPFGLPEPPREAPRQVAPDDDPEFLNRLGRPDPPPPGPTRGDTGDGPAEGRGRSHRRRSDDSGETTDPAPDERNNGSG